MLNRWRRGRHLNIEKREEENLLQILQGMEEASKRYLEEYLDSAPIWLLNAFHVKRFRADQQILRENEPVDRVYILVEGVVRGIDYQESGENFECMWFGPVTVFGSMEILLRVEEYRTTLETVTPCLLLEISRNLYEKWMLSDCHALLIEISTVGNFLLDQVKQARSLLFMEGRERLLIFMARQYKGGLDTGECHISATRQQIADCTGLSVRTVNRLLRELETDGLIQRKDAKIRISGEQFQKISEQLPKAWYDFFEPTKGGKK